VSPAAERIIANASRLESADALGYSADCGGANRSRGSCPSGPICQMLETRPVPLRR
jgi:hypothetical protein